MSRSCPTCDGEHCSICTTSDDNPSTGYVRKAKLLLITLTAAGSSPGYESLPGILPAASSSMSSGRETFTSLVQNPTNSDPAHDPINPRWSA